MSSYSIRYSAVVSGTASTGSAGDVLIPDAVTGDYVKATTAARASRRATGIAMTAYVAGGTVDIAEAGVVGTSVTGFTAAAASWVRCSATGTLEKVTPGSGDDLLGKVDTDGRFFLDPGKWDSTNYTSAASFTAGGDLSGSSSSQTVEKVKGTTITTAGGSLAVGAVLRTTAVGTADWGAVNLADTDAVTGVLPKANQGAQDMAGDVTGTTAVSVVAKVNGITCTGTPAAGAVLRATSASAAAWGQLDLADTDAVTGVLPTGNVATTLTSKTLTTPVINGQTLGAAVAVGALAIDWTLGTVFTKTLSAGGNTFTFSGAASGMTIVVRLTSNGGGSTVTWPTVLWAGGAAPTQTSTGVDVYTFVHDGTSIYGSVVQAMA